MTAVRRVLFAVLLVGVLGVSLSSWALAAASARADEPVYSPPSSPVEPAFDPAAVCPGGLGRYEGSSDSVATTYAETDELAEFCRALLAGIGRLRQTTYWSLVEGLSSQQLQREGVAYLHDLVEAPSASGGSSSALEESGFESLRFVLWFIAGVIVCAIGGYVLVRLVVFRDN